ncbi:MAG: type IX secretion system membrane protein PorP/SprF [Flavobacteriaceae bacterium]
MKNSFILLILLVITSYTTIAQQDAQYTQYMYNTIAVNPAYAGSRGAFSIAALHRSQWVGLDGAPTTQTFNFHTPLSERVGVGLSIVNDEIGNGTSQETYFDADFSYTVPTSNDGKLSFGLKAGGHLLNLDFNKLQNYQNEEGISGLNNIEKKFSPNFGAGIYYYTDKFYSGISIPNLLRTDHFSNSGTNSSYLAQERINLYVISGYVFELNQDWKFKPAGLLKMVKGAPLQIDLSANFLLRDKFVLGAAYRWDAALSALFGFHITDQLMLGLSYDKETTELGGTQFNDGSFEIFLRYELPSRNNKATASRFF